MIVANKPGPKGPNSKVRIVPGSLRQTAWRAMQIKQKFSLSDLIRNALPAEKSPKDPRNNLGRYVKALADAGVLVEMKHRLPPTTPTSRGEKRWMLVRDLGRQAPVLRGASTIFDPNSGRVIEAEVCDVE